MTWLAEAGLYVLAGFMDAGVPWARVVFTWLSAFLAVMVCANAIHIFTKVQRKADYRAGFLVVKLPTAPTWSVLGLLIACLFAEAWLAGGGLVLLLVAWLGLKEYQLRFIAETRIRHEVEMNGQVYH